MSSEAKTDFLRKEGIINPRPERVVNDLFQSHEFFDPLDLPQVRYEMLRIARVEQTAVIEACRLFGFSREYFYRLERDFMSHGYAGLLGSFKGRRPLIAMNQEIVNFIVHRKMADPNNCHPPGLPEEAKSMADKQELIKQAMQRKHISRIRQMLTRINGVESYMSELQKALEGPLTSRGVI
jgi:hypothetical protein